MTTSLSGTTTSVDQGIQQRTQSRDSKFKVESDDRTPDAGPSEQ